MSSIDLTEIRKGIYDWVSGETKRLVIWDSPNTPRPKKPYVLLQLLTVPVKIGRDSLKHISGNSFGIQGQRTLSLRIMMIGGGAVEELGELHSGIEKPKNLHKTRKKGIAFWDEGTVTDVSTEIESGIEERASVDILLGVASNAVDPDVGYIEHVELSGLVDEPAPIPDIVYGPEIINP